MSISFDLSRDDYTIVHQDFKDSVLDLAQMLLRNLYLSILLFISQVRKRPEMVIEVVEDCDFEGASLSRRRRTRLEPMKTVEPERMRGGNIS